MFFLLLAKDTIDEEILELKLNGGNSLCEFSTFVSIDFFVIIMSLNSYGSNFCFFELNFGENVLKCN